MIAVSKLLQQVLTCLGPAGCGLRPARGRRGVCGGGPSLIPQRGEPPAHLKGGCEGARQPDVTGPVQVGQHRARVPALCL